jgi:hypothetical protein
VFALAAVALAFAFPLQPPGCNQTAHYALIQALVHGSPRIDQFQALTCDTAYWHGHLYAAKAPGFAMWSAPWYAALRVANLVPRDQLRLGFPAAMIALPRHALWQISLWGSLLPAVVLVVLLGLVGERLEPGRGWVAAILFALGTLIHPFATMLFSHVFSSTLLFASFALLFFRRSPLAAGLLAGLAISSEYPSAIAAGALGLYAWHRLAPYAAGVAVGVLPALAFSWWAFGSPTHIPYETAVKTPGRTGHDVLFYPHGRYGLSFPRLHIFVELLFSSRGLIVLSPLCALAGAGLVLLWRRGFRAEAGLAAGVVVGYIVFNSGYSVGLGGYVPGPRFLISMLPFLALGLAPAAGSWPLATTVLGSLSVAAMTVATAAEPLLKNGDTVEWLRRWWRGSFTETILGGTGWLAITPYLVLVLLATVAALLQLRATSPG